MSKPFLADRPDAAGSPLRLRGSDSNFPICADWSRPIFARFCCVAMVASCSFWPAGVSVWLAVYVGIS